MSSESKQATSKKYRLWIIFWAMLMAVAATDQYDGRASFSSTGPAVEISAPGKYIYSTYPGGIYTYKSGTSMACPHISGIAALLISVNSDLANNEVRTILQQTAEDLGLDPAWQGYGLARADSAVSAALGSIESSLPARLSAARDLTQGPLRRRRAASSRHRRSIPPASTAFRKGSFATLVSWLALVAAPYYSTICPVSVPRKRVETHP